ncbi:MAG TPA: hypothetical protein VFD08_01725 [Clostridia bacterium]|nr:hypothetical protein [Clostridia bacterium]
MIKKIRLGITQENLRGKNRYFSIRFIAPNRMERGRGYYMLGKNKGNLLSGYLRSRAFGEKTRSFIINPIDKKPLVNP